TEEDLYCQPIGVRALPNSPAQKDWNARYDAAHIPTTQWIAFVLAKGGTVVPYDGNYISVAEQQENFRRYEQFSQAAQAWDRLQKPTREHLVQQAIASGFTPEAKRIDPEMDVWWANGEVVSGPIKALELATRIAEGNVPDGVLVMTRPPLPNGRYDRSIRF